MPDRTDHFALGHFARIVQSSDDAIISKDLDGTIRSWNQAAEKLFGYTAEEVVGQSIRILMPPDRQQEEDEVLSRIRTGHDVYHFETLRRRKDGSLVPISLTVSPIRDDHGQIIGASKIARDITERHRLQALADEQSRISERLSDVGAAVASSLDHDTIVQRVTDIATDLTQAEFGAFFCSVADEQSAHTYMLHTLSDTPKSALANLPQPRATDVFRQTLPGEGAVRLADVTKDERFGKDVPYIGTREGHLPVRSYLAVPVKDSTGQVLGGLVFGHSKPDMFTVHHERLATGTASWASLALENSRLYASAREADRLKDEFLAVLSHELRTPLSAIVGYTRLLREGVLVGEKADRGFETLERNARALAQIVEDVLDTSRIASGKMRLDVQPVELPVVIHDAVATVQPAADAKGVRVQAMVDPHVGPVSGDPNRLRQVVWNLLSNAVKFTPRAGRVDVRLERVNSHAEIVVTDTGTGIGPEFIAHVFERFRQANAGTTRSTGGLGLGLSIVKNIVEAHGGSVGASSDGPNLGSTFRVKLPLTIGHAQAIEPREYPRTGQFRPAAPLGDLRGITVAAVDDEPDALALLGEVLRAAGANVVTFPSAALALEGLRHTAANVLIADLGMPVMDGLTLIERIRASSDPALRDIPAAALTAFARSEDRTKALRSGFEMHLAKPVDPGELIASVATLVRRLRRPG